MNHINDIYKKNIIDNKMLIINVVQNNISSIQNKLFLLKNVFKLQFYYTMN